MIPSVDRRRPLLLRAAGAAVILGSVVVGCGSDSSSSTTTIALPPRVVVTSVAGNVESQLIASMYAQALESSGLRVVRRDAVADRDTLLADILSDEVQVAPLYSGDLLAYLDAHPELTPATTVAPSTTVTITTDTSAAIDTAVGGTGAVDSTVAATLPPETTTTLALPTGPPRTIDEQVAVIRSKLPAGLTIGDPSAAEHKQSIACSAAAVEATTVGTFTDLGTAAANLNLGGPAGFETSTPLGLATIEESYGARFKSFTALADDKLAEALTNKTVDCIVTESTDPIITEQTLTPLLDDKALVPPNALLAVTSAATTTPDMLIAVSSVNTNLTTALLAQMVDEVVVKGSAVDLVASLFLQSLSSTGS